MDVVRKGVLIRSITKLGSGLGGVLIGRKLSGSTTLPTITAKVVGTPLMVFTNLIMTTHVNMTIDLSLMSSMAARRYRSVDVANPRG
jgi:hypothetical protein